MRLEEVDLARWEDHLPPTGWEVFHAPEALSVLAEHTSARMELYAAYRGEEPMALLPLFVEENSLGRAYFSPPRGMGVPRLGPILMPASPKQHTQESRNRDFVDLVIDRFGLERPRTLLHMECSPAYTDPRPFGWADMELEPAYTYVLDLDGRDRETVLGSANSNFRKEVRRGTELPISVAVEGPEAVEQVWTDLRDRFADQPIEFPLTKAYMRDVVSALEDRARVYVARDGDGHYLGGLTVLYSADTAAFWQGGAANSYEGISVNSVLHWAVISDIIEDPELEEITAYDLVGANTPRLCRYKSKLGGDLVSYVTVESGGIGMTVAKSAYRLLGIGTK